MMRPSLILAGVLFVAASATAAVSPQPSATDPRLRVVKFVPDEVVRLDCTLGYVVTLTFGPGERVENVSVGDGLGWQITPNHRANVLFLKPVDRAAPTNMTVITNLRSYAFELRSRTPRRGGDKDIIFGLKFDYPEAAIATPEPVAAPPSTPEPPRDVNHAYSYEGASVGLPVRVFDDGQSTYFVFAETSDFPAIFAVDADKKEAVVNVAHRDGYVVVDRLARAFVLRRGDAVTRIVNDGYREDSVTATSLKRRK